MTDTLLVLNAGFHDHYGREAGGRAIIAHLGSGASLCGMKAGRSVATTMGFSPLDGLLMSTRCGSIDPQRNRRGETVISASGSAIEVLVIPTGEERAVAEEMLAVTQVRQNSDSESLRMRPPRAPS